MYIYSYICIRIGTFHLASCMYYAMQATASWATKFSLVPLSPPDTQRLLIPANLLASRPLVSWYSLSCLIIMSHHHVSHHSHCAVPLYVAALHPRRVAGDSVNLTVLKRSLLATAIVPSPLEVAKQVCYLCIAFVCVCVGVYRPTGPYKQPIMMGSSSSFPYSCRLNTQHRRQRQRQTQYAKRHNSQRDWAQRENLEQVCTRKQNQGPNWISAEVHDQYHQRGRGIWKSLPWYRLIRWYHAWH